MTVHPTRRQLPAKRLELPLDRRKHLLQHPLGYVHSGTCRPRSYESLVLRTDADLKLMGLAHRETTIAAFQQLSIHSTDIVQTLVRLGASLRRRAKRWTHSMSFGGLPRERFSTARHHVSCQWLQFGLGQRRRQSGADGVRLPNMDGVLNLALVRDTEPRASLLSARCARFTRARSRQVHGWRRDGIRPPVRYFFHREAKEIARFFARNRSASVAAMSTVSVSRSTTTPYACRACSTVQKSSSTSSSTFSAGRSSGSP